MNHYRRHLSHRRYSRYAPQHLSRYERNNTFMSSPSPCSSNYRCSDRPYTTPLPTRVIQSHNSSSYTRNRDYTSRKTRNTASGYKLPLQFSSSNDSSNRTIEHFNNELKEQSIRSQRCRNGNLENDSSHLDAIIGRRNYCQCKINAFLENSDTNLTSHNLCYSSGEGNSYRSNGCSDGSCQYCSSGHTYSTYNSLVESFTESKSSSSRYSKENSNTENVTEESNLSIDKCDSRGKQNYDRGCNRNKSNKHKEVGDKRENIKRTSKRQLNPRELIDGIDDEKHHDKNKDKHRDSNRKYRTHDQSNESENENNFEDDQQSWGNFEDNRQNPKRNNNNKENKNRQTVNKRTKGQEKKTPGENCKVFRIEDTRRNISKKQAKGKTNEYETTESPIGPVRNKKTKSKPPPKENGKPNPNNKEIKKKTNLNNNMNTLENVSITENTQEVNNQTLQAATDKHKTNTTTNCGENSRMKNSGNERNNNKIRHQRNENQDSNKRTNEDNETASMTRNENQDKMNNRRTNRDIEASKMRLNDKGQQNQDLEQESKDTCDGSKDFSEGSEDYSQGSQNSQVSNNSSQGSKDSGRIAGNQIGTQQDDEENQVQEELEIQITAEDVRDNLADPIDKTKESQTYVLERKEKNHKYESDGSNSNGIKRTKHSKRRLPKELDFDTYFETTFADHINPKRFSQSQRKSKTKNYSLQPLKEKPKTKSRTSIKRKTQKSCANYPPRHCSKHSVYNFKINDLVTKNGRFVTPRDKIMTKYLLSSSESLPGIMKTKKKKIDYFMNKFEREWDYEMEILKSTRPSNQANYQSLGYW